MIRKAAIFFIFTLILTACNQTKDLTISTAMKTTPTAAEMLQVDTETPTKTIPTSTIPATPDAWNFTPDSLSTTGMINFSVDLADVDQDGDLDLFVPGYDSSSQLWINDGSGAFSRSSQKFGVSGTVGAHDAIVDDFNGDGFPDIFLLFHHTTSQVYLNDGSGNFGQPVQEIETIRDDPQYMAASDADGDGDLDVFISYPRTPNALWLNDGAGMFERAEIALDEGPANKMGAADFNDDGFIDVFFCYVDRASEVWLNDGTGQFPDSGSRISSGTGCDDYALGDVDGSGSIDIVLGSGTLWLNDGEGEFTNTFAGFAGTALKLLLFDVDLDGDLDLLVGDMTGGNKLYVYQDSEFIFTGAVLGDHFAHSLAAGDLDRDGDLDVVVGCDSAGGSLTIWWNLFQE